MSLIMEILISALLIIGGIFTFVGGFGLIKLDNPMSRLHAPTKAGTLGVGAILLASMIYAFEHSEGSVNELLILAFLFVTAPVSAHFISKLHIHRGRAEPELPDPGEDTKWSTLDKPVEDPRQNQG